MANMYNINDLSYTTHENMEWFTRAMFGGRLVQGGYVRVLTGIKGGELLSMIDLANKVLQIDGRDCAWTPNQIIKLSEKTAQVKTYKINLEQCIDELEQKRTLFMLSPGAHNESLPTELEAATLALIAIGLSNEIEELIVAGDHTIDPNAFDGMQTIILGSADSVQIVGATVTKTNILQAIEDVYNGFSEDVLQAEDAGTLFILGSYANRRKLREALAGVSDQTIGQLWTVDDTDKRNPRLYYLGVEYVPVKGIGKNTFVGYDSSNAYLLTDLLSDLDGIELGPFPKPYDNKVWVKGRLRLGFVIPFEDEVVIWSDLISEAQPGSGGASAGLRVVPNSLVFTAAGETKTFTIYTDTGITPNISAAPAGFTVSKGTTTAGVTVVTVVAAANTGNRDPKVGEVDVELPGATTERSATVTLNQRSEDVDNILP